MNKGFKQKRLRFPLYITEGNVIFLNKFARLTGKEVADLYNHLTSKYLSKYSPDALWLGQYDNDKEFVALVRDIDCLWTELHKRKILFTVVDSFYVKYEGE